MNNVELAQVVFTFVQESNCLDSGDTEEIVISVRSDIDSLPVGGFYTINTEQWAFDDIEEFAEILERVKQGVIASDKSYRKVKKEQ
jgi:hypothetical protein